MKLNENEDPDSNQVVNGRLYVKVIAAENLDLPIDYGNFLFFLNNNRNNNEHMISNGNNIMRFFHFPFQFYLYICI